MSAGRAIDSGGVESFGDPSSEPSSSCGSLIRRFFERLDGPPPPPAAPPAPAPAPRLTVPPPTLGAATLRSPLIPPPGGAAPAPHNDVAPPSVSVSLPKVASAPAFLKSTGPAQDPAREQWPFRPAPPGPPPPRRHPKTLQAAASLEKTAPLDDGMIAKALAGVPFPVVMPTLTLQQYTSLCAELSVRPQQRSEILPRYQVYGEAARAALDARWQKYLAEQPEARAAFERDLARFTEWLRSQ